MREKQKQILCKRVVQQQMIISEQRLPSRSSSGKEKLIPWFTFVELSCCGLKDKIEIKHLFPLLISVILEILSMLQTTLYATAAQI